MHWRAESSTGVLACDTPSVAVHAAGCEALCARLLGLVRVSSGGVVRGGGMGWARGEAVHTRMHAVKYGFVRLDPSPYPGLQTA
jgi:hypothetical protein